MEFIGLDIGTSTIKAVQLRREPKRPLELFAYASAPAPSQPLASEAETDLKEISSSLAKFVDSNPFMTRKVVVALPESAIFTRVISLPRMSEKELRQAMQWEAEQYIPVPLGDVSMDWNVLDGVEFKKGKGKMDVLLIAAPKNLVEKYLKILAGAKLEVVGIETETIAVARSLVGEEESSPSTLIVNIGAETTDIAVVVRGAIRFTRSISTGGTALARAVSQNLGFDLEQAEEYKRTYGLDETQLEGKVMKAIKPIFDVIVSEIKRSISFYASHESGEKLKRVVICGGTASLPGIIVYLAATLDLEVQIGNPWRVLSIPAEFSKKELEEIGPSFAVAVGLALKEL